MSKESLLEEDYPTFLERVRRAFLGIIENPSSPDIVERINAAGRLINSPNLRIEDRDEIKNEGDILLAKIRNGQ